MFSLLLQHSGGLAPVPLIICTLSFLLLKIKDHEPALIDSQKTKSRN